jgi:hypothetical protein
MNYGSMRWLSSSLLLIYMEATETQNYPYYIIEDTRPQRALWEFVVVAPLDGCTSTASLHCTKTTLAIMPCVLRFEASRCPRANRSHRFRSVSRAKSSVLALWLSQVAEWFCGELLETPAALVWTPHQSPLMTYPPWLSRLDLDFEAQPRNHTRLRLGVLATMRPTLDPTCHRVPRIKPSCLSTPGGPPA